MLITLPVLLSIAALLIIPFVFNVNWSSNGHGIQYLAMVERRQTRQPFVRITHDSASGNPGVQISFGDLLYCLWWH